MNQPRPITWSDQPTSRPPMMKILHAPPDRPLEAIIVNEREVGVFIHWRDDLRRNQPCQGTFCTCQQKHLPIAWKAYLGCFDVARKKLAIAELTSPAWQEAGLLAIREKRGTLRGLKLSLSRFNRQPQGRVMCKVYTVDQSIVDALPDQFDVKAELERIWFSRV